MAEFNVGVRLYCSAMLRITEDEVRGYRTACGREYVQDYLAVCPQILSHRRDCVYAIMFEHLD